MTRHFDPDTDDEYEYRREREEAEQFQMYRNFNDFPEDYRDDAAASDIDYEGDDRDSDEDEWLDEDPASEYDENDLDSDED